jgi:O-antigen/teichoic acid export membrane protein
MNDAPRNLPPALGRLLGGSFWIAIRTLLQAVFGFWSVPLILDAVGAEAAGAYAFAWGFGFLKSLLEFGMGSALQRQASEAWAREDRAGVDRAIAAGMVFYAATALVQAVALLAVAAVAVPRAGFHGPASRLVVRLLWLQALTAPCYGLTMVVASVLQAHRRYALIPKLDALAGVAKFSILVAGLRARVDLFAIVAAMTAAQIGLTLGPSLRVMVRVLGHVPHFGGARRDDLLRLLHVSTYIFLIQLSVVLATKVDTTVLGFALADPGPMIAAYGVVSRPYALLRQVGTMLAGLVMPATASLRAARDERGLEQIRYDVPRLHIGLLLPAALLAWIDAAPFLELWVGRAFAGRIPELARLLRLSLVAALPLAIAAPVQMAIGAGRVAPIARAALAGALVNLPLSYALAARLGVAGVIWGTVLTGLVADLLVPGLYAFRSLRIRPSTFLARALAAPLSGALALIATTWAAGPVGLPSPGGATALGRSLPLLAHLGIGVLAYLGGYLAAPAGRADLALLDSWIRRRLAGRGAGPRGGGPPGPRR